MGGFRRTRAACQRAIATGVCLLLLLFADVPYASAAEAGAGLSGADIMARSQRRHQLFPYVYEEQSMILIDAAGHRNVRRSRLYTRMEAGGSINFLLVFDQPETIRGVALLARRSAAGRIHTGVYLPAFGPVFKQPRGSGLDDRFLGTDFSIADLTPEPLDEFRYVRQSDRHIDGLAYFVVDAYPREIAGKPAGSYGLRKHLLRQDNYMIVQTDVYDSNLNFYKRISYHDLKQVDGDSWRANMIVAHDRREAHRTVLKIDRRVYSQDYVPAVMFDEAYLLGNRHVSRPAASTRGRKTSSAEQQLIERFQAAP